MTDKELVKKLREVTSGKLFFTNTPNHLRLTAADRIEELDEELVSAQGTTNYWIISHLEVHRNLGDKLAKALAALEEAIYMLNPDEEDMAKGAGVYRIVTTYKELKGET